MLPEYTCNFLATLAHPPWRTALRRTLHMTLEGEERTLFSYYVQPSSAQAASWSHTTFFPFKALPDELQLRVLGFCSASTLFQLMRVSSWLRTEASKLFWAHPGAYFLIEAWWLVDGGYPGYTHSDLAFLANVQNVQIDYGVETQHRICPLRDGIVEVQQDRIAGFWEMFTKRCPKAKRVIINQCCISTTTRDENQGVPEELQLLVRSSPLGIAASTFIVEGADVPKKWQRAVYHMCADSSWEKIKLGQDWKTILVPAKQHTGPVGRFQEIEYRGSLLILEEDGLWPILVEAVDRYHFGGGRNRPFSCPAAGCNGYFEKAGEWTIHAAEWHNQDWMGDDRCKLLPQAIRGEFEERFVMLADKRKNICQDASRIREEWKRAGKEQQRGIRLMWIEQLKNDPAWETGEELGGGSRLFQAFWEEMNAEGK